MTTSLSATTRREQFALAGVKSFVLRGAVAAGILRILGFDGQFDEASAKALHLLFGGGTHVVGGSDRAQPARGGDGLQAGDAGADDENTGGSDGAGSGGHHGKNSMEVSAAISTALYPQIVPMEESASML